MKRFHLTFLAGSIPSILTETFMIGIGSLVFISFLLGSGYLLFDNDALYADVIRHMVVSGDWLNPQIHGVPFLDKPPLFYWMGSISVSLFGETIGALRSVAAVFAALTVSLLFYTARRTGVSRMGGFIGVIALIAIPLFVEYSRRVYMEVPVAFCVFATTVCLQCGISGFRDQKPVPNTFFLAGLFFGLAFMFKSLVALFPLIAFGLLIVIQRRFDILLRAKLWLSVLVSLCIIVPWHMYQLWTQKDVFLQFTYRLHVQDQILNAQPWSTGPFWFYFNKLVTASPLLAIIMIVGLSMLGYRVVRKSPLLSLDKHLSVLIIVILLILSISETKKDLYLITLIPPSVLLFIRMLDYASISFRLRVLIALSLCALLIRSVPYYLPDGGFLQGSALYARAAIPAQKVARPEETLYLLDQYFSSVQYYANLRAISYWTNPTIVEQTQRIPYIRYGHNMNYVHPAGVKALIMRQKPGLWYLHKDVFQNLDLEEERYNVLFDQNGLVLIDTAAYVR